MTLFMPDFFEAGSAFPVDKFPPKSDQDKEDLQKFFGGIASPPENVKKLTAFGEHIKSQGFQKVGAYGFCWGTSMYYLKR